MVEQARLAAAVREGVRLLVAGALVGLRLLVVEARGALLHVAAAVLVGLVLVRKEQGTSKANLKQIGFF